MSDTTSPNSPANPPLVVPQRRPAPSRGTPNFQPNRAYRLFLVRLRLARQEKGVSQRELARRLNVHHSSVQRAEDGYRPLHVVEVRAWCQALDIPLVQFTEKLDTALSAASVNAELSPDATSALAALVNEPQSDDAYGDSTDDLPADVSHSRLTPD